MMHEGEKKKKTNMFSVSPCGLEPLSCGSIKANQEKSDLRALSFNWFVSLCMSGTSDRASEINNISISTYVHEKRICEYKDRLRLVKNDSKYKKSPVF